MTRFLNLFLQLLYEEKLFLRTIIVKKFKKYSIITIILINIFVYFTIIIIINKIYYNNNNKLESQFFIIIKININKYNIYLHIKISLLYALSS